MQRVETNTYLKQHVGDNGIYLVDQLEEGILGQTLQRKLPLGHITGVGFTKDRMSITGNNLATSQSGPHVLTDGLI